MLEKVIKYFKATNGKKSMKIEHQVKSGISKDDFISIYDNYEEWCLVIACMFTTYKNLPECETKRLLRKYLR